MTPKGSIKVVMTGSASDPPDWQQHVRNKPRREALANRFRDADDPFRIVLVRDMWLTGFDAPSLHTMYVDKPMRGHGLMQAIARVNRVFKDKPGGLGGGLPGAGQRPAAGAGHLHRERRAPATPPSTRKKRWRRCWRRYDVCCALFHGFDWSKWTTGTPAQERLGVDALLPWSTSLLRKMAKTAA